MSAMTPAATKELVAPLVYSGPKRAPEPEPLSDAQQQLYDTVLTHFNHDSYTLKFKSDTEPETLTPQDKFWLSREGLLRYLRATKWVATDAIKRLEETLKWRREYGMTSFITPDYVEPEGKTGKIVVYGYDADLRPSLYLLPSRQNTDVPTSQLQYTFWNIEKAIDLMEPGVESLVLLIDFADKAKNPSISTAKTMLNILQNHYPERLGKALVINIPYLVKLFLNLMMPFVDPITRAKIALNPLAIKEGYYEASQITKSWGGEIEPTYDHEKYWPELVRITEERRTSWFKRWEELGGSVGISEREYKVLGGGEKEAGVWEKTEVLETSPAVEHAVDASETATSEADVGKEVASQTPPQAPVEAAAVEAS